MIGGPGANERNIIAFNGEHGVEVERTSHTDSIRANSIHSNGGKGIENTNRGNMELPAPIIDNVPGLVSSHTDPKCYPCTVEVFSDNEDKGRVHHGFTTTSDDPTRTWTYTGAVTGPNITATVTDADGNTSEFSAPVAYSPPVGGIAGPRFSQGSRVRRPVRPRRGPAGSLPTTVPWPSSPTVAAVLIAVGGWYARRRWLR
jgi:hypothetical protein